MNTEYATMNEEKNEEPQDLNLREDLIRLSFAKEIKHSEAYLKKASMTQLEKIKLSYERTQLDKTTSLLTETLVTKFSELLEQLDLIQNDEKLDAELSSNKLFCDDVKSLVKKISPYIPMIGLLTGGIIIAKHVWDRKPSPNKNVTVQNDENSSETGSGVSAADPNNS